ncbi:MAG: hypothetical protein ACRELF_29330, partial [Gemmataceae bacterium]
TCIGSELTSLLMRIRTAPKAPPPAHPFLFSTMSKTQPFALKGLRQRARHNPNRRPAMPYLGIEADETTRSQTAAWRYNLVRGGHPVG